MSGRGKGRKKHGEGSYNTQKHLEDGIDFTDFRNPWTFSNLCLLPDDQLFKWLRDHNLLADKLDCTKCMKKCTLYKRTKASDGYSFRCSNGHEFGMRKFSFFQGSCYNIRDLMLFIQNYLDGHTLHRSAISAGMEYKHTSVVWANHIRQLFCQYVNSKYQNLVFQGDVEIDESLFGRKIKYNRGKPTGNRIWIFGIVERSSNRLIMYPVDKRDANTLIPLIIKHVSPGSRIFSDSWAAYLKLNELEYTHFSVSHKSTFKQKYKNTQTGEIVTCCTNRIEGAWKLAKDHFRRINGTNSEQFEQHLSEIVWRSHVSSQHENISDAFFNLVKNSFRLSEEPSFNYPTPLFPTWTPPTKCVENSHAITIVQGSDDESDEEDETSSQQNSNSAPSIAQASASSAAQAYAAPTAAIAESSYPTCAQHSPKRSAKKPPSEEFESDDSVSHLFFPSDFKPVKCSTAKKTKPRKTQSNPYSKSAFVYTFSSSDSDFA